MTSSFLEIITIKYTIDNIQNIRQQMSIKYLEFTKEELLLKAEGSSSAQKYKNNRMVPLETPSREFAQISIPKVNQQADDLQPFDPDKFAEALFVG